MGVYGLNMDGILHYFLAIIGAENAVSNGAFEVVYHSRLFSFEIQK